VGLAQPLDLRSNSATASTVASSCAASALAITTEAAITARSVTSGALDRMRSILRSTTCWRVEWCARKNRLRVVSCTRLSDPSDGHRSRKSATNFVQISGNQSRTCGK
jgi:hypothetical protein